jgi:type IV pilus assembly protein PilE
MRKATGFSLIELLIVMAIIGILAGIGIPAYTDYLTRAKIAEAVSALSDMRVKLERHFQDNRTYVGACAAGTQAPLPATKNFVFTCPELTATTYRVQADGVGFTFDIDQANVRRTTAVPAEWNLPGTNCWVMSKSGGC